MISRSVRHPALISVVYLIHFVLKACNIALITKYFPSVCILPTFLIICYKFVKQIHAGGFSLYVTANSHINQSVT